MAGNGALYGVLRRFTTLGGILLSVLFIVFGGVLLYFGSPDSKGQGAWWLSLLRDFGSLFVVTGVFTILWELVGRRALFDEFWTKAQLAESVRAAGLSHVADSFRSDVDWPQLLRTATKLDIFFAYGRTWRNTHSELLEALLRRGDGRVRLVLPDPGNAAIMSELARRFEQPEADVVRAIGETKDAFSRMATEAAARDRLEIWVVPLAPLFTFYRIDQKAVMATYRHKRGRGTVPALVMDSSGFLYEFVSQEFDALLSPPSPLGRRIV